MQGIDEQLRSSGLEAQSALRLFHKNYNVDMFGRLSEPVRTDRAQKPRFCRFCQKSEPTVQFNDKAHAVPASLGNRWLIAPDECDDCNKRFSFFDDDLAKMIGGERTIGRVKGRNGVPKLRKMRLRSHIETKSDKQKISHFADEPFMVNDPEKGEAIIRFDTEMYRPLGAYKCLAKIAYALLPRQELGKFEELRRWLLEIDVETNRVYSDGYHICIKSFVPGFRPFQQTGAILLTRQTDIDMNYCILVIGFGNISLQIFVPCPQKDLPIEGKELTLKKFPLTYDLEPWLAAGPIQTSFLDLSSAAKQRESGEFLIKYTPEAMGQHL